MADRRKLDADEQRLWQEVARTAKALHPGPPRSLRVPEEQPQPARPFTSAAPPRTATRIPSFRIGERATGASPAVHPPALRMDAKTHARLIRGKLSPEARIDLHGMVLAEAHPALTSFVLRSREAGHRLILVITGKGSGRSADALARPGVIRQQVPHWLRQVPLAALVLQVTQAHARHGGAGALYIYLKRG